MEKTIDSPFCKGGKARLITRELRLWYQHQWILGSYYEYECETTGKKHRTDEVKEENKLLAEKYLQEKIRPVHYD